MALVYWPQILPCLAILISMIPDSNAIQCYQCDSNEDTSCPQWLPFDRRMNALVDCYSFESKMPGEFCIKIYRESTGWHSWIKITRRCASRTEVGVAWGCRYGFEAMGIYREVCFCSDRDGCNSSINLSASHFLLIASALVALLVYRS